MTLEDAAAIVYDPGILASALTKTSDPDRAKRRVWSAAQDIRAIAEAICDPVADADADIEALEKMAIAIVAHQRENAAAYRALNISAAGRFDLRTSVHCEIDFIDLTEEAEALVRAVVDRELGQ